MVTAHTVPGAKLGAKLAHIRRVPLATEAAHIPPSIIAIGRAIRFRAEFSSLCHPASSACRAKAKLSFRPATIIASLCSRPSVAASKEDCGALKTPMAKPSVAIVWNAPDRFASVNASGGALLVD